MASSPAHSKQHRLPKRGVNAVQTLVTKSVRKYTNTSSAAAAETVDPNKPLTASQLEFVKYWAQGESITSATMRAGYADVGIGYRLRVMPNIRKQYELEKLKYEEAAQMTRKTVMDMHLEAFQMAKLMSEPASMVSAAREIGRMCGYYEPIKHTVDVNVKGEVQVRQLNAMSDADLLKLLTGEASLPAVEPKMLGGVDEPV